MKASKKFIRTFRADTTKFIQSLSFKQLDKLGVSYSENKRRTVWSIFWRCRDNKPEQYDKFISELKDSHIETALKRAVNTTF